MSASNGKITGNLVAPSGRRNVPLVSDEVRAAIENADCVLAIITTPERAHYGKALCAVGAGAGGTTRSGRETHLAGREIAARGTWRVHGNERRNNSFQIN